MTSYVVRNGRVARIIHDPEMKKLLEEILLTILALKKRNLVYGR